MLRLPLVYILTGLTTKVASVLMTTTEKKGRKITRMSLGTTPPRLRHMIVSMVITSSGMNMPLEQLDSRTGKLNIAVA